MTINYSEITGKPVLPFWGKTAGSFFMQMVFLLAYMAV